MGAGVPWPLTRDSCGTAERGGTDMAVGAVENPPFVLQRKVNDICSLPPPPASNKKGKYTA